MTDVRCQWCEQVTVTIPEGEEKAECPNCLWLVYITPPERREPAVFNATLDLISRQWPHRGDYFGARLTLRSLIRHAKYLRDQL